MSCKKILIVEDEEITAEDIRDTLDELGYVVIGVISSGKDAVKKVEQTKPDLILMDIALEGEIDGVEAALQIKQICDVPIIFLTAYSDTKTIDRVKNIEPEGFILKDPFNVINKPFKDDELKSVIEITLHKYK